MCAHSARPAPATGPKFPGAVAVTNELRVQVVKQIVVAAVLSVAAVAVQAAEVVRFSKGSGRAWQVGDNLQMYFTDNGKVGIQMMLKKSTLTGRVYYVVGFQTRSGQPVEFGARVSDSEPSWTHFTGRAAPGKVYTWGEHLPANLDAVYVLYDGRK